ncbi:MAG: histidinol dehydrogenase [Gemmatimonadaceae bacterium]|nr:histidinol dehydrogenase [Gemmatimonadaceae bacterium]
MSQVSIAVRGTVAALDARAQAILFDRTSASDAAIRQRTSAIITRVRAEGDAALLAFAREFDGAVLTSLEVPQQAWRAALEALAPALRRSLERAAANIWQVHEAFRPVARETVTADGAVIGRRPDPLGRVGVYAPGGRAAYPSSVLMGVIPARVAGVGEVIVCTPPGPDGLPSAVVMAAAELAGADRLFAVGGAGAIAAMAYGTATIPGVDRIVGPGNAYVAEAKAQVSSVTAIDSPAGPSELLVIADDSASPSVVARELLAQAEHDPMAAVVLVGTSATLLDAVADALITAVPREPRAEVIRASLASRGGFLLAASLDEAVAFSNRWAPEHLLIATREPDTVLRNVRNAGTVFVGETASVAFGDYLSGANHVLPTGGLSRAYSGLSTIDFYRWTTWQRIDRTAAARLASDVGVFADAEGLPAHASAARQWQERDS